MSERLTELPKVTSTSDNTIFYGVDQDRPFGNQSLKIEKSDFITDLGIDAVYVNAVTDLETVNSANYKTAVVKDTVRGGLFFYDNSASPDSVTSSECGVKFPSDGAGAWVRSYNGSVNVDWFGAVGDGVTDDTDAIKKCIDVVGDYVDIEFNRKQYVISDTITFLNNVNFNNCKFLYNGDDGKFAFNLRSTGGNNNNGIAYTGGFYLENSDKTESAPITSSFSKTAFTLSASANCTNITPNAFSEVVTVSGAKQGCLAQASFTTQDQYGEVLLSATVTADNEVTLNWNNYSAFSYDIDACDVNITVWNNTYHGICLGGSLGYLEQCKIVGFTGVSAAMGDDIDSFSGVDFTGVAQCYYWDVNINVAATYGYSMVVRPRNNENTIGLSTFGLNTGTLQGVKGGLVLSGLTNNLKNISIESPLEDFGMAIMPNSNQNETSGVTYLEYSDDVPALIAYKSSSFNKINIRAQGKEVIDLGVANELKNKGGFYVNGQTKKYPLFGENLLLNGNFNNKFNHWTDFGSNTTLSYVDGVASPNALRVDVAAGRVNVFQSLNTKINTDNLYGKNLTLSGWVRTNIAIRFSLPNLTNSYILKNEEWQYVESTIKEFDNTVNLTVQIKDFGTNQTGFVELSDLNLNIGVNGNSHNNEDRIFGKLTVNNPSIAAGAVYSFNIDVDGAERDDFPVVSNRNLNGLLLFSEISTDDEVKVTLYNPTGLAIDMSSSTFYAMVTKRFNR